MLRERLIPSVSARLDALSSDAIKHVTIGSFLKVPEISSPKCVDRLLISFS
jgi:hypothetical protein